MNAIILESVLFFALVAVVGVLLFSGLKRTPLGARLRQNANRKAIDEQAEHTCPIHGLQKTSELVRLSTGEVMCPHCYKEAVQGVVD
ncbi:MAG: hypothetical protein ABJB74_22710 [Gemmatimonas sp.]